MQRRHLITTAVSAAALAACASSPSALLQPSPSAAVKGMRIAFGSCMDQDKPQPMWAPIMADKPDLFIFGGDNVYASKQPFDIANTHAAYAKLAGHTGFDTLRKTVPHIAIWDDHDYGLNDGGVGFAHKQASKQAYLNFWGAKSDDPRHNRDGVYHAYTYGTAGQRVQVILLDVRWNKSPWKPTDTRDAPGKERYVPDTDPNKTMLGAAQWAWLEQQLKQPADVRLIVSGIQVVTAGHGWEAWAMFPNEQRKLYELIRSTRANGVVMLSGDRHIGALYQQTQDTPYPLYEMTSSGMTHPWETAKEPGPNRLGELFTELHYGMIEIDWAKQTVALQLKDQQNRVRREQLIALASLQLK